MIVGVFATALLIANWQAVALIVAILVAEQRPGLLKDASWDEPASAARFHERFHAGASERDLTAWLNKNGFAVDARAKTAAKQVNGLPCTENIKVNWSVGAGRRLTRADAVVSQVVCL